MTLWIWLQPVVNLQIHVKLVFSRNLFCKRMRTRRTLQKCFAFVCEPNSLWNLTWNSLKRFGRNVLFLVGWWLVGWLVGWSVCHQNAPAESSKWEPWGTPKERNKTNTYENIYRKSTKNRPEIVPIWNQNRWKIVKITARGTPKRWKNVKIKKRAVVFNSVPPLGAILKENSIPKRTLKCVKIIKKPCIKNNDKINELSNHFF